MKTVIITNDLEVIHFILAYASLILFSLIQIKASQDKFAEGWRSGHYIRKNGIPTICNIIFVPMLLILYTDPDARLTIQINYLTAIGTGFGAQSVLHTGVKFWNTYLQKKLKKLFKA